MGEACKRLRSAEPSGERREPVIEAILRPRQRFQRGPSRDRAGPRGQLALDILHPVDQQTRPARVWTSIKSDLSRATALPQGGPHRRRTAEGKPYEVPQVRLFSILAIVSGRNSSRGIATFIDVHRTKLNVMFGLHRPRAPAHTALRGADDHIVA